MPMNINITNYVFYFNTQSGIVAGYSISGFHALISTHVNDYELEKYRGKLTEVLVRDTTFFPILKELYPRIDN